MKGNGRQEINNPAVRATLLNREFLSCPACQLEYLKRNWELHDGIPAGACPGKYSGCKHKDNVVSIGPTTEADLLPPEEDERPSRVFVLIFLIITHGLFFFLGMLAAKHWR
jgi:hypothetical protein